MIRSSFFINTQINQYFLLKSKQLQHFLYFMTIICNFIVVFACFSGKHSIECKRIETKKIGTP